MSVQTCRSRLHIGLCSNNDLVSLNIFDSGRKFWSCTLLLRVTHPIHRYEKMLVQLRPCLSNVSFKFQEWTIQSMPASKTFPVSDLEFPIHWIVLPQFLELLFTMDGTNLSGGNLIMPATQTYFLFSKPTDQYVFLTPVSREVMRLQPFKCEESPISLHVL